MNADKIFGEYDRIVKKMSNNEQLKSCPFCGGKARIRNEKYYQPNVRFNIICSDCYSNSGWYKTETEAVEAWNKRTKLEVEE